MIGYTSVNLAYSTFEPETTADVSQPPFIFLHGITSCRGTWGSIPQLLANETRRKAYTFDARNHGDSDWSDAFEMDILVCDLLNFMDSLKVAKAFLIGHSMGGRTALMTALLAPERVEMLVVEEMSVNLPPVSAFFTALAYTDFAPKVVQLIPKDFDEMAATKFIMKHFLQNYRPDKAAKNNRIKVDFSSMAMKRNSNGRFELKANMPVLERYLRNAPDEFVPPHGSYDGLACFIYGKMSHLQVASDADAILKHFPRATIVGIENAGHNVHIDRTPEFLQAVLDFVRSNGDAENIPQLRKKFHENASGQPATIQKSKL